MARPHLTRRRAIHACVSVAVTALVCAGLLAAAALVPAPPLVLVFVIIVSIGCPMAAAYEFARAVPALRDPAAELRRQLDRLPETEHPLGL
jgi:hypothetical protein